MLTVRGSPVLLSGMKIELACQFTFGNEKGPMVRPENIDAVAFEEAPYAALAIAAGDA
jgi:hypothetical protein